MSEMTHEEALRQADVLVSQALKQAEGRCAVLGQFVNECDSTGSRPSEWSEALRELRALQSRRSGLMRRHSLIRQALDLPVGECPAKVPLSPPRSQAAIQTQHLVQLRGRPRRERLRDL